MTAVHYLACDEAGGCPERFGPGRVVTELRQAAVAAGWKSSHHRDRCPAHAYQQHRPAPVDADMDTTIYPSTKNVTHDPADIARVKARFDELGDTEFASRLMTRWD